MEAIANFAGLGLNLITAVVAVVLWLTRNRTSGIKADAALATADAALKTRLDGQGREIGDLKKRLDDMADSHQLVARLEERINALTSVQQQLPQIIAQAVEKGISAALGAVLNGARRTA